MASLLVSAVASWNGKALSGANREISAFDKTVNRLGKTFASVFAAQKIASFGKASVMAFAADEKAARSLALQLKNTGNQFATPGVEAFIANLQKTTNVLDDQLRPAFQTLLTATGNVYTSMDALNLALDVSAGTTRDLQTVSVALAKGYSGQTTGLSRLSAGLSKATLKTGDMSVITSILSKKFEGQALEAAKTYAGQMAALGVAVQNTKELIGKGLLDSIALLGGQDGIQTATTQMEGFALEVSNAIYGVAVLIDKLDNLGGNKIKTPAWVDKLLELGTIGISGLIFKKLAKIGATAQAAKTPVENYKYGGGLQVATIAKLNKLRGDEEKILTTGNKAKLDALKLAGDQKALDDLKKKMDVERTDLAYALTQATDDETRARIAAKIAILDGDAKAAAALNTLVGGQIIAADQMLLLASAAASAAAMLNYLKSGSGSGGAVYGTGTTPGNTSIPAKPAIVPPTNAGTGLSGNAEITLGSGAYATQGPAGFTQPVVVNVNAGVIGNEQTITDAIQNSLQQMLRYGWSTNYAGGL
jgi:hypothetical protein